jgi:acetyl esterase/lipase
LHWRRKAVADGRVSSGSTVAKTNSRSTVVAWRRWERGDKNGSSGAELLAAEGFVTASSFYRLSGDSPFPAAIEDCKCALRYLRANAAKYSIDPSQIGVAGASAGGHLAMLVAMAHEDAGSDVESRAGGVLMVWPFGFHGGRERI